MASLPPTRLLLVVDNHVIGEFNNYLEIARYYGVSIDGTGQILFPTTRKATPTYALKDPENPTPNQWHPADAIRDWARCHMRQNLPRGTHIYRFLSE